MENHFGLYDLAFFVAGASVILGQVFPVIYKFKGGKGIATTLGVFMVADPITSCILFCILIVTLYFIKISSVVSMLFITINAIVQFFRDYSQGNWVVIILLVVMVLLDIIAHRKNFERLVENKENAADLQEGLEKDIQKLKDKKQRKLNRNEQKQGRIEERYERKIEKKHRVVNKKIEKLNSKNSESVSNPINEEKSKTSK